MQAVVTPVEKLIFQKNIISCNRLEMSESLSISLEYMMKYIRSYDTVVKPKAGCM